MVNLLVVLIKTVYAFIVHTSLRFPNNRFSDVAANEICKGVNIITSIAFLFSVG